MEAKSYSGRRSSESGLLALLTCGDDGHLRRPERHDIVGSHRAKVGSLERNERLRLTGGANELDLDYAVGMDVNTAPRSPLGRPWACSSRFSTTGSRIAKDMSLLRRGHYHVRGL